MLVIETSIDEINIMLLASQYMNDMWRFNLKEAIWEKLDPVGDAPDKRSNHTAVYDSKLDRYTIQLI
jgi:hypothetical protein